MRCRLIASAITAGASRVATGQLCLLAVAITPAGLMELVRSYCPINGGPPTKHGGRAPALIVSRPAQRSLHVTACMLAKSPKRPSTPEAPTASFPPPPLRLLPGGANPVPGRDFHPQSTSAFSRRTRNRDFSTAMVKQPIVERLQSVIPRCGINEYSDPALPR